MLQSFVYLAQLCSATLENLIFIYDQIYLKPSGKRKIIYKAPESALERTPMPP